MIIPDLNHIGLWPINRKNEIASPGLFLTPDEFHDMVEKSFSAHRFSAGFLDYIFDITAGHVSAAKEILGVVSRHSVSPLHQT
jgi:hypothetical protein